MSIKEPTEKSAFDKLNNRQKIFVLEYVKDLNGTQAAIRAGYSKKTAVKIASENQTKPDIKAAINEKITEILNDKEELILKTQRELECLAFSDMKDYVDFDDENYRFKVTNESDTRAIKSIKIKRRLEKGNNEKVFEVEEIDFDLHGKKGALDSLKQMLGIADKLEISPISLIYLDKEDENL